MDGPDFWLRLEYRVCSELEGFEDRRIRFLSCDGLSPEHIDLEAPEPCIRGRAWIHGHQDSRWTFTLFIGQPRSEAEIDWPALLPAEDRTGWLTPDVAARTLTMSPLASLPDGDTPLGRQRT
ncbi:hypothetical protein [Actinomadura fibrosa]|uniref:Uncharacterized protein n=1 Tax=Actinomadura fibrosa TaxID=111802 RepID=A0ABW2XMV6_9ACTN|nr:hypothetical protein [Actinomadura fibrosa]